MSIMTKWRAAAAGVLTLALLIAALLLIAPALEQSY